MSAAPPAQGAVGTTAVEAKAEQLRLDAEAIYLIGAMIMKKLDEIEPADNWASLSQGARDDLLHAAAIIATTVGSLTSNTAPPFVTMALLYALFLLTPWFIFVSYMTTKRYRIARATREDLTDFGLLDKFIDPTYTEESSGDTYWARIFVQYMRKHPSTPQTAAGFKAAVTAVDEAVSDGSGAAERIFPNAWFREDDSQSPTAEDDLQTLTVKRASNVATNFVIREWQFHSIDYLLPLLLLTAVSAIGWYYVFLAGATTALYDFIARGGSTGDANAFLVGNMTPFTIAFLGGWIFITVMLFNNWMHDDLYPRRFFYAAVHLTIATIVGFACAAALGMGETAVFASLTANAIAFLASITPYDSIELLAERWFGWIKNLAPGSKAGGAATTVEAGATGGPRGWAAGGQATSCMCCKG